MYANERGKWPIEGGAMAKRSAILNVALLRAIFHVFFLFCLVVGGTFSHFLPAAINVSSLANVSGGIFKTSSSVTPDGHVRNRIFSRNSRN